MKNIIGFILGVIVFSACSKTNDRAFDQSPDQRVKAVLDKYQKQIEGAQYGWMATVETKLAGNYIFHFKFSNDNRVTMYSSFDSTASSTPKESSYRLKALQQVSLLFDTYSYIHLLSDPDPSVANGELGSGYGADFEYYFDDASTTDTIKLVGRKNGTHATLIRATQQEALAVQNKQLAGAYRFDNLNANILNYWKQFTIAGTTYEMDIYAINQMRDSVTISWKNGTALQAHTAGFKYNLNGGLNIVLNKPLVNGSATISEFKNVTFNTTTSQFTATINGTAITFAGAIKGINIDNNAPTAWRDAARNLRTFWAANWFHVNGVDDPHNLTSINVNGYTYYYLMYWPSFGGNYDLFGPAFLDPTQSFLDLLYGYAVFNSPISNILGTSGVATFVNGGTPGLTSPATPIPANSPFFNARAQLRIPQGYYLVRLDSETYDMVSANDAKAWITWYLQ